MSLSYSYLSVTTNAGGGGTVTAARKVGVDTAMLLYAIEWVDGTIADGGTAVFTAINTPSGVDKTLATFGSAEAKADATYYPRVAEHDTVGAANGMYAMQIVNGDLQLVVSAGGSVTTCGAYVYLLGL